MTKFKRIVTLIAVTLSLMAAAWLQMPIDKAVAESNDQIETVASDIKMTISVMCDLSGDENHYHVDVDFEYIQGLDIEAFTTFVSLELVNLGVEDPQVEEYNLLDYDEAIFIVDVANPQDEFNSIRKYHVYGSFVTSQPIGMEYGDLRKDLFHYEREIFLSNPIAEYCINAIDRLRDSVEGLDTIRGDQIAMFYLVNLNGRYSVNTDEQGYIGTALQVAEGNEYPTFPDYEIANANTHVFYSDGNDYSQIAEKKYLVVYSVANTVGWQIVIAIAGIAAAATVIAVSFVRRTHPRLDLRPVQNIQTQYTFVEKQRLDNTVSIADQVEKENNRITEEE